MAARTSRRPAKKRTSRKVASRTSKRRRTSRLTRNPKKVPSGKRLVRLLEEECGAADTWHGRCAEIAHRAGKLVGHHDVYGHYRGPVHKGGFWGARARHPFIQHGWVKLPAGKVLDPTRFSFEHKDPYIYVGEEKPEYDEGGQITRSQIFGRSPPGRHEEPTKPLSLPLTPDAARAVALIFGPDETDLGDDGRVTITTRQAFHLANSAYDALQPFTWEIYKSLKAAGLLGFVPLDNLIRAEREGGKLR